MRMVSVRNGSTQQKVSEQVKLQPVLTLKLLVDASVTVSDSPLSFKTGIQEFPGP